MNKVVFYCDRCGKELVSLHSIWTVRLCVSEPHEAPDFGTVINVELCEQCRDGLARLINTWGLECKNPPPRIEVRTDVYPAEEKKDSESEHLYQLVRCPLDKDSADACVYRRNGKCHAIQATGPVKCCHTL